MNVYEYGSERPRTLLMFQCTAEPWWALDAAGEDPEAHYRKIFDFEKHCYSGKTIWNSFWSANNYAMPDPIPRVKAEIEYWYGEEERKARKADIAYVCRAFPQTALRQMDGMAHGELAMVYPERFYTEAMRFLIGEGA